MLIVLKEITLNLDHIQAIMIKKTTEFGKDFIAIHFYHSTVDEDGTYNYTYFLCDSIEEARKFHLRIVTAYNSGAKIVCLQDIEEE